MIRRLLLPALAAAFAALARRRVQVRPRPRRDELQPPRPVRVPAASKVMMANLIVERGKRANYTYKLEVNDSLSRRALRKEFEAINEKFAASVPKADLRKYSATALPVNP